MFSCKSVGQVLEHRYRSVCLRKSLVLLGGLVFRIPLNWFFAYRLVVSSVYWPNLNTHEFGRLLA